MSSEYTKLTNGSETKFDVVPASKPIPFGDTLLSSLILFSGLFALGIWVPLGMGMIAIAFFALYKAWLGADISKYRHKSSFTVAPEGITVEGRMIPVDDIHRLIIRNHIDGMETGFEGMVYNSASLAGASAAIGAARKSARLKKLSAISCRLDVEAGGSATTLAGGLSDTTAFALMKDVGKIVGIN